MVERDIKQKKMLFKSHTQYRVLVRTHDPVVYYSIIELCYSVTGYKAAGYVDITRDRAGGYCCFRQHCCLTDQSFNAS